MTLNRGLTQLCFLGYFLVGTVVILIAPLMPSLIADFGLSLAAVGLIFPAKSIGSLIGGLFAGVWSDLVGRRPLISGASFVLALALCAAALAPRWPIFLLGFLVLGLAQGAITTGINALAADLNQERRGRALNSLHGVYSIGAAIAPLIIGWLSTSGIGWRWVLGSAAFIWLLFAVASLAFRYPAPAAVTAKRQLINISILKHELFLLLFVIAFIYNGVAWSLLGWMNVYLEQSAGLPAFLAAGMISVFYIALTLGRFACAYASERWGYGGTLLLCAAGTTLTYPLVVLGSDSVLGAFGVFICGLFIAGLFPTALAYGNRLFPDIAGTVSGTMSVAMIMGTMVPPWWTGVAAETWSFQTAIGLNYILVIPLVWIAVRLRRGEAHSSTAPAKV